MSLLAQTTLLTLYRDAFDALWRDDPQGLLELNGLIAKAEDGVSESVKQGILKTVAEKVQKERKACPYCGGAIHAQSENIEQAALL